MIFVHFLTVARATISVVGTGKSFTATVLITAYKLSLCFVFVLLPFLAPGYRNPDWPDMKEHTHTQPEAWVPGQFLSTPFFPI